MDFARPRPAADIVDAPVVDGDHGKLSGRGSRRGPNAPMVGEALQALDQLGPAGREQHERHHQTEEPVFLPEARLGHRLPLPLVLIVVERATRPECSRILRQPPLSRPSLQSCAKGRKLLNKQNSRRHFYSECWGPSNFPIEANPAGGAHDPCDGVRGVQRRHPKGGKRDEPSLTAGGPFGRGSGPEQGARGKAVLRHELGRGYFLAVFVLCLEDLDPSSLGGHEETRGADFGNLSDLAFYRAERSEQMFAAVEDLQFLAAQRGPGAGGGVAAAYQVVSEIDVRRPVDFRFGGAAPAFVSRAAV